MARHQCLNCGEPFEGPEFTSYILKLRSKTVKCLRCLQDNFIVPKKNASYILFLLIALTVGIVIFLTINIGFAVATYSDLDGSFKIGWLPIVGGAMLSIGTMRLLMNLFNWLFGCVSQDKKYKSVTDYE